MAISNLQGLTPVRLLALGLTLSVAAVTLWHYSLDRQDRDQLTKLFSPGNVR
jgi:hypothetical protein